MRDSTGFSQCGSHREYNAGCGFCRGETVIRHAAKEPEIVDLQNFLVGMGADVSGAGTSTITIRGTNRKLNNVEHTVIPDRIVAGTYLVAAGITGGELNLKQTPDKFLLFPYHRSPNRNKHMPEMPLWLHTSMIPTGRAMQVPSEYM